MAALRDEVKTPYPIIGEEEYSEGLSPTDIGSTFWLVDPLDGTKEFISKNGEFTVNIALIDGGRPVLQLANGIEMPLEQVSTIESPLTFAQALVGRQVMGVDRRDPSEPKLVEGLVTGVAVADTGEMTLELDTGQDLRLSDLIGPSPAQSA